MQIVKDNFIELIKCKHSGDYRSFAVAISMDSSTVFRILNGKMKPGGKFFGNFLKYCKENCVDMSNYFFEAGVAQKQCANKD